MPYFSIITCTRNSERFLKRNIDSVNAQDFTNYEHIFVDGKSKDKSRELVKKYSSGRLIIAEPKGISNAMNIGIKEAKGAYIIHLHSDDSFFSSDVLQNAHDFLENLSRPDWIYGKIQTVEEDGSPVGVFPRQKIFQIASPELLKFINFIPHQAVFINKEIFREFGIFEEELSSQMDYDYWLKIKDKTRWNFFPKIVSKYMLRTDAQSSGSRNKTQNSRNRETVLKRHLNNLEYALSWVLDWILKFFGKVYR